MQSSTASRPLDFTGLRQSKVRAIPYFFLQSIMEIFEGKYVSKKYVIITHVDLLRNIIQKIYRDLFRKIMHDYR